MPRSGQDLKPIGRFNALHEDKPAAECQPPSACSAFTQPSILGEAKGEASFPVSAAASCRQLNHVTKVACWVHAGHALFCRSKDQQRIDDKVLVGLVADKVKPEHARKVDTSRVHPLEAPAV